MSKDGTLNLSNVVNTESRCKKNSAGDSYCDELQVL